MYVAGEALRLLQKRDAGLVKDGKQPALHAPPRMPRSSQLQEQGGQGHQVHPRLGSRWPSPWLWAWARWSAGSAIVVTVGEKDRQGPPHLRAGRHAPKPGRPWPPFSRPIHLRPAGLVRRTCTQLRRGRDHGCQSAAACRSGDSSQHRRGRGSSRCLRRPCCRVGYLCCSANLPIRRRMGTEVVRGQASACPLFRSAKTKTASRESLRV
jgi:hypothetical protein